jgi:hypothetical protein
MLEVVESDSDSNCNNSSMTGKAPVTEDNQQTCLDTEPNSIIGNHSDNPENQYLNNNINNGLVINGTCANS